MSHKPQVTGVYVRSDGYDMRVTIEIQDKNTRSAPSTALPPAFRAALLDWLGADQATR